ncbi:MAG: hypothetical protein GKR92_08820 [Gammaproteobacteria bacterium]|nr:MAG: hypothetical protein GKR92_08820 [Gammaproteobacteria bacterium]
MIDISLSTIRFINYRLRCNSQLVFTCLALALALHSAGVGAHGGVFLEQDVCIIEIDFYKAHFTIYQPQISKHEQFCEDIPEIGESTFVMEYLHDGLRDMQVDFRIIKDTQKLGRFAKLEDIEKLEDIQQQTIFYQAPTFNIDGVYLAQYDFTEKEYYIGIVTAKYPDQEKIYTAVFPFQVGGSNWGYIPAIISLALFLQLNYWLMNGGFTHLRKLFKS